MPTYRIPQIKNRSTILAEAQGLKGENFPRLTASASGTLTDGTVQGVLTPFLAGDTITNLHVFVTVVAVTASVSLVGVYNSSGTRLAQSADLGTAWESTGTKTHALTAPLTITSTGGYYLAVISKGATPVSLLRGVNTGISSSPAGGSVLAFTDAGETSLPSTATMAAGGQATWFGWS